MNQAVDLLLNTGLVALEYIMFYLLVTAFFSKRRSDLYTAFTFFVLIDVICFILFSIGNNQFIRWSISAIICIVWIYICFYARVIKGLFVVAFWLTYVILTDYVGLALAGFLLNKNIQEMMLDPYSYYLLCFCVKTVGILGVVALRLWIKQRFLRKDTDWADWLRAMLFPLASFALSIYLLKIFFSVPELTAELLMCAVIVLAVDVVSVFLLDYLEKQSLMAKDNAVLRQNIKLELDNIAAWQEAYAGQRKQTHDFQNQLIVIRGLVEQDASKPEIIQYLEQLQNVNLPTSMLISTRRAAVDIILNQKLSIAKNKNIIFKTQLDDLSVISLPDEALVVVLSNLIDNAIEACEKIEDTKRRFISLKIKILDGVSFLHIENSTSNPVNIKGNKVITTKRNAMEHGYGLQNVTTVLEQHKAIYSLNYRPEDKVFSFSAQIG